MAVTGGAAKRSAYPQVINYTPSMLYVTFLSSLCASCVFFVPCFTIAHTWGKLGSGCPPDGCLITTVV